MINRLSVMKFFCHVDVARRCARAVVCCLLLGGLFVRFAFSQDLARGGADTAPAVQSLFDGESLAGWEITNFGTEGGVRVEDGVIMLYMGDALTGITWKRDFPRVNYEVSLEAMRVDGGDFFCGMTFPVKDDPLTLIVGGWGGVVVGLSSIDGKDASQNDVGILKRFDNNRWYHIRLRVTDEKVQAWIDEEQVVDFTTGSHKLSIRPEVLLSRPFGIATWQTTGALRNIVVRTIAPDQNK